MSVNDLLFFWWDSLTIRWVKIRDELRPAVCFGPREGVVKKSQAGDGGLHAVGQSPGAAEPREPRAQMAEELQTRRRRNSEALDDPSHQALLPFYFLTQISSSPSMLQRHDSPAFGWGRRILHLQTQPGVLDTLAAAKSAEPTKAGLERQSDFLM